MASEAQATNLPPGARPHRPSGLAVPEITPCHGWSAGTGAVVTHQPSQSGASSDGEQRRPTPASKKTGVTDEPARARSPPPDPSSTHGASTSPQGTDERGRRQGEWQDLRGKRGWRRI
nr:unnamed protein product [Digitaria exilis]CAB3476737.1 unnamed protein product [Digitaria exilis]